MKDAHIHAKHSIPLKQPGWRTGKLLVHTVYGAMLGLLRCQSEYVETTLPDPTYPLFIVSSPCVLFSSVQASVDEQVSLLVGCPCIEK